MTAGRPDTNWTLDSRLRRVDVERTSDGIRVHYPSIGFAAYGEGRTLNEAMQKLEDSRLVFEDFVKQTPEYEVPEGYAY